MRTKKPALVALLIAFWGFLYLTGLGATDVDTSLEGFRVAAAERMISTGDWVVPHLADRPYYRKPPLCPWTIAVSSWMAGGVAPFPARLPSALSVLATALLIWGFARRRGRGGAGMAAAFFYLVLPLVLEKGRRAEIEASLALLVFASLAALYESAVATDRRAGRRWALLGWAALGFALLDKGPPALVFVVPPMALYHLARKGRGLRVSDHLLGGALAFGIFAAWMVPMLLQTGVAPVWDTFVHEAVERVVSEDIHNAAPVWYYLAVLPAGAAPALVPLPWLFGLKRQDRSFVAFLATSVAVPLILFSFFEGKDDRYLLPAYPALALLAGYAGVRFRDDFRRAGRRSAARAAATIAAVALVLAGVVLGRVLVTMGGLGAAEAWVEGGLVSLVGVGVLLAVLARRLEAALLLALLAAIPAQAAFLRAYVPARNAAYSPRPMCEAMLARTPAGTPITVTEWTPPQVLAYLGDRVRIRHDLRAAWQDAPPGAHVAFWLPLEHGADVLRELIAESGDLLQDVPLPWRGATHRYLSAVRNRDKR